MKDNRGPYQVGVYKRNGKGGEFLFSLCPDQPTYAQASFAVQLIEAVGDIPLAEDHFIACGEKPRRQV